MERRSWRIPASKNGKARHVPLGAKISVLDRDAEVPFGDAKQTEGLWERLKVSLLPSCRNHQHPAAGQQGEGLPNKAGQSDHFEIQTGEVESMQSRYEIVIYWSDEDGRFLAEVPELAGCMADGANYQEAVSNVEIVIEE